MTTGICFFTFNRQYYSHFGVHPNLWKFCRCLLDLQEMQENEELQYLHGGNIPSQMKKHDRRKEEALYNLKELYISSPQDLMDAYNYVTRVSFRMRRYNMTGNDVDFDDAP